MTPEFDQVLAHLAATLLGEIAPLVPVDYAQKNTQIAAMLLTAGVEEWDRAVERRVEENRALRALLLEAVAVVADPDLGARLQASAAESESPLRISSLNTENHRLRALLIELHAHVERLDSAAAHRVEDAIWTELLRSTERRKLSISPF